MAVQSGIDSDHYWELNFNELMVQIIANNRNHMLDMRTRALMDHKQSEMMAFALNDPSKMPKLEEAYPFLKDSSPTPKPVEQVQEWQQDQLEFITQANKIKAARQAKNT
ncbi:hypothetical protein C5Z25_01530 [Lactobacillus sp. CBA3605]|nr:hypothetical protein C5Z25_01530 [Lactobacillus sp. CBA3605]